MLYIFKIKCDGLLTATHSTLSSVDSKEVSNVLAQKMFERNVKLISVFEADMETEAITEMSSDDEPYTLIDIQMEFDPSLVLHIQKNGQRILERIEVTLRAGNLVLSDIRAIGAVQYLRFERPVTAIFSFHGALHLSPL